MISIPQDSIFFYKTLLPFYLLLHCMHPEEEETSDCSGCLSWSTCSVAILDHGKIIESLSLVDFNFVAVCQGCLRLFCRCDVSHEFKPVWIRATDRSDNDFYMSHEATCCSNLSRRLVASCVSALKDIRLIPIELIRYKRDSVRKAREAHLMNKAKTLHPFGKNRRDEARQWHIWHLFAHSLAIAVTCFYLNFYL